MPGLQAQLTSSELTRAIKATETLCSLEPYIDRLTWVKIDTLRADLLAEQEDRAKIIADA